MRAVVCQNAELDLADRPEPVPGRGQVRLEVLRCGICGSDLHARHGLDDWADMAARAGYDRFGRSQEPVVFGHEFCGSVAEYGPKARGDVATGSPVVALPLLRGGPGVDTIGLSVHAPGAYAEQLLVEESMMLPVPNGLSTDVAAMTEPMAVAYHAVRRGEVGKKTVALVIGCGPVGLGVILMLKARGVRTVVASDYSAGRRALATACGADVVVDPAESSPHDGGGRQGPRERNPGRARARGGHHREAQQAAVRLVARFPPRRQARRRAQAPGHLRVRRRARRDPEHHRRGADVLPRRGGRRVRRHRPDHAGDGHQQGDRPAVRGRLHAAGVPRHAAHARRGQGGPAAADHRHGRARGVEGAFDALANPEAHAKILIDPQA